MNVNRDEILKAAAHGNAAALDFLRAFAARAHWLDDLVDRDKLDSDEYGSQVMADEVAKSESVWLLVLSANLFFLAHKAQLVPAMVLALNAWADSEEMEGAARDVVKGQWHEVVWLVAWLTGGWQHLRATSSEFRSYDFEPETRNPKLETRKEANGLPG